MCGRFTLKKPELLADLFQLAGVDPADVPPLSPRYNVSPSQSIAAVRVSHDVSRHEVAMLKWGLIPSWAKDAKIGYSLINARSETIATKPSFRAAFKKRRCLIPADGFFEWKKVGTKKLPVYMQRGDRPFMFAGLWEWWEGDGKPIESCTIITTEANSVVKPYHDRMPVVLTTESFAAWLDTPPDAAAELLPLLKPSPAEEWSFYPVSTHVNSPKYDDPECVALLAASE